MTSETSGAGGRCFEELFTQAPLGIALIESLTGRIQKANPMFARITARSLEEISELDWMSITHPDDVQKDLEQMALLNAGEIAGFRMEKRYLRPDGAVVWISMTIAPVTVEDPSRPLHLCMIEDISALKRAEAYGEMRRQVLQILNQPGEPRDAIRRIITELKAGTGFDAVGLRLRADDDFPYAAQEGFSEEFLRTENSLTERAEGGEACRNEKGELKLECACGLVLSGKSDPSNPLFTPGGSFWTNDSPRLLDLPAGEDPRLHPRNRCVKLHYSSVALIPVRNKERIIGLIQLNGRRAGMLTRETVEMLEGIAAHIGEALARKRAEEALNISEKRFMDVLHASSDAVFLVDRDRIVDCNAAAMRMAGYQDKRELLKTHPAALSPAAQPDGESSVAKAAEIQRLVGKNGFHQFHWTQRNARGEDFPVEVSLTTITMRGRPLVHCVWRDLTALREKESALATAQKIESLGTLAGGIAHDFNNILTAIMGNLSLLQSRMTDAENLELAKEAQDACGSALGLSNQLLTFAKGGSPVFEVMDLRPVLEQSAAFAARGTGARCVFRLGAAALPVAIDKAQISRVIQNLVLNAAQAMPEGGEISLRAETVELGETDRSRRAAGRYVRLTVEDQGPGIKPGDLSRIFDPYFSTKGMGRGLGLATCYSIMTKHGGHISAELRPGAGAIFTLHFPAANAEDCPPEKASRPAAADAGRILIMDDEAAVAKVLTRMLAHLGYRAEAVRSGEEALEAYRLALESGTPFDAVILDLTVRAGMGGMATVAGLKALDPKVKALVSSGYANDPILSECAANGFAGVLGKPYRLEDVSEALRSARG